MWTVEDRERYKDDGRRYPSDLTDAEWELVRSLFETYPTLTKDIRAMVDGCLYLGAEGCRWRSRPTGTPSTSRSRSATPPPAASRPCRSGGGSRPRSARSRTATGA